MNLLEVNLENPIEISEVVYLRSSLIFAKKHDFLIINTGRGNFKYSDVLKNYINHVTDIEPCFMKFKKVAFVQPSKLAGMNFSLENIRFFNSRVEALRWFAI